MIPAWMIPVDSTEADDRVALTLPLEKPPVQDQQQGQEDNQEGGTVIIIRI